MSREKSCASRTESLGEVLEKTFSVIIREFERWRKSSGAASMKRNGLEVPQGFQGGLHAFRTLRAEAVDRALLWIET